MNILSRICDIRPRVKYMMSRIRDNRPMSVNNNNNIIIIGFSTVGQENRYKRETGDETVDRLHHLVVQLERKKKINKNK